MAVFEYRVTDHEGKSSTSRGEAASQDAMIDQLIDGGYFVVEIREVTRPRRSLRELADEARTVLNRKVSRKELTYFYMQLSTLIGAGVTLVESLDSLGDQCENPKFKAVILDVRSRISAGQTFHEAAARHDDVFDALALNMIKAGETGAGLDDMLQQIARFAERDTKVRTKVRSAMTYPIVLSLIATGIVFFLVTYVFPRFTKVFAKSKTALPLPTVILMKLSAFLQAYWVLVLLGAVGLAGLVAWVVTTNARVRRLWDGTALKLPVLGPLLLKADISRFCRTLGTLLNGGVPIIRSLEVCESLIGNVILKAIVAELKVGVAQGLALYDILKNRRIFPSIAAKIIQTGEKTGTLPRLLVKTADFFEYEVEMAVDGLITLLEPLMIVVMGCVIGFIAIAMFLPMFDMTSAIK